MQRKPALPVYRDVKFTEFDAYLFGQGTNDACYRKLGAHPCRKGKVKGTCFALWAPHARAVHVLTERNGFSLTASPMKPAPGKTGVWQTFLPEVAPGELYRFAVTGIDGEVRQKTDPFAFQMELRPGTGGIITSPDHFQWQDEAHMASLSPEGMKERPLAIYEVHLGSWKKDFSLNPNGFLNYRQLADQLVDYVLWMGYTHVELIGLCEHPFDGSWGYQCSGFFAPTSRHGTPDDFRYFVDRLHRAGIGVILDWVPAHFPRDHFCLGNFDGTPLYEYEDPLRQEMPGWGTLAFDHGKNQVRSFLISSALYWVREFHLDAIRVDAVASMLLNSYGRQEWRPNSLGGEENLEGMAFLRQLNDTIRRESRAFMIAEDSSITKGITDPVAQEGFGFAFKWNLGWMNDTLKYFAMDPIYRRFAHEKLTGTMDYAFFEYFILVLSHDEVVHLKHSMLEKMPGDPGSRFAQLKCLYALQMTFPGKKLLFMGQEFAQEREWDENRPLDWELAQDASHRNVLQCERRLLALYRRWPSLYTDSRDSRTLEWVNRHDDSRNILCFIRRNPWNYEGALLVIANLSPVAYPEYSCGVPLEGEYRREFSSCDSLPEGGAPEALPELPPLHSKQDFCDGYGCRLCYALGPYETLVLSFPQKQEA